MTITIKRLDGRVDRASAFGAVDSGLIPSRVKPVMTLKLVFTTSCLTFNVKRDSVERHLAGFPQCWCVRQMAGNS